MLKSRSKSYTTKEKKKGKQETFKCLLELGMKISPLKGQEKQREIRYYTEDRERKNKCWNKDKAR